MPQLPNERDYEITKPITAWREKARALNLVIKKAQTNNYTLTRMLPFLVNLYYCSILVNLGVYAHTESKQTRLET